MCIICYENIKEGGMIFHRLGHNKKKKRKKNGEEPIMVAETFSCLS